MVRKWPCALLDVIALSLVLQMLLVVFGNTLDDVPHSTKFDDRDMLVHAILHCCDQTEIRSRTCRPIGYTRGVAQRGCLAVHGSRVHRGEVKRRRDRQRCNAL